MRFWIWLFVVVIVIILIDWKIRKKIQERYFELVFRFGEQFIAIE